MFRNTRDAWGAPAKLFHWLMAALMFAQIPLGLTAAAWPLSPLKLNLFVWHKSVGMLILALALLRLAWRFGNPVPELPAATGAWERRAARASHALLYLLLLALPVSGWVINSAANIPLRIFWLVPLPAIVGPSRHTAELAAAVHFGLFVFLATLLLVHIGAALRHHYVKRNDVLTRMLPRSGARP